MHCPPRTTFSLYVARHIPQRFLYLASIGMALDFEAIKTVNPKVSNLIFGFFRESHSKYFPFKSQNPYYALQPLLIYTCIAFYNQKEWDATNTYGIKLDDDNVIKKSVTSSTTTFIKDEISKGCHEYEFKVINYSARA